MPAKGVSPHFKTVCLGPFNYLVSRFPVISILLGVNQGWFHNIFSSKAVEVFLNQFTLFSLKTVRSYCNANKKIVFIEVLQPQGGIYSAFFSPATAHLHHSGGYSGNCKKCDQCSDKSWFGFHTGRFLRLYKYILYR